MCIGPSDPRLPNTAGAHHHLTARRREGNNLGTIVGACAAPLTAREHFRDNEVLRVRRCSTIFTTHVAFHGWRANGQRPVLDTLAWRDDDAQ